MHKCLYIFSCIFVDIFYCNKNKLNNDDNKVDYFFGDYMAV